MLAATCVFRAAPGSSFRIRGVLSAYLRREPTIAETLSMPPQEEPAQLPSTDPRVREALDVRRWSVRSLKAAPPTVALSFGVGWLDPEGGETLLAATALVFAFVAAFFGLAGLFGYQYSKERLPEQAPYRWAVTFGITGILGGFLAGLVGLVT